MARPGKNIEALLLAAGRELYAERGAAGLAIRALTGHAGVNLGMFHYHFRTKDAFLRQLLQGFYEEMFADLAGHARQPGRAIERLREALFFMGRFVRERRPLLVRVLSDAASGEAVATEFLRENAPRHLQLLLTLMDEAQREGDIDHVPPVQRFVFVMSAVAMPLLVGPFVKSLGVAPRLVGSALQAQVMSDAAIRERIELALAALARGEAA